MRERTETRAKIETRGKIVRMTTGRTRGYLKMNGWKMNCCQNSRNSEMTRNSQMTRSLLTIQNYRMIRTMQMTDCSRKTGY